KDGLGEPEIGEAHVASDPLEKVVSVVRRAPSSSRRLLRDTGRALLRSARVPVGGRDITSRCEGPGPTVPGLFSVRTDGRRLGETRVSPQDEKPQIAPAAPISAAGRPRSASLRDDPNGPRPLVPGASPPSRLGRGGEAGPAPSRPDQPAGEIGLQDTVRIEPLL